MNTSGIFDARLVSVSALLECAGAGVAGDLWGKGRGAGGAGYGLAAALCGKCIGVVHAHRHVAADVAWRTATFLAHRALRDLLARLPRTGRFGNFSGRDRPFIVWRGRGRCLLRCLSLSFSRRPAGVRCGSRRLVRGRLIRIGRLTVWRARGCATRAQHHERNA